MKNFFSAYLAKHKRHFLTMTSISCLNAMFLSVFINVALADPGFESSKSFLTKAEPSKLEQLKSEPSKVEPIKIIVPIKMIVPIKIIVPPWQNDTSSQNSYFIQLLALAFSKTEAADGAVEIQAYPENLTGTRFVADLKNNKTVNVIWHGTNLQRERDLIAIPISLAKALNEYRVLLIRKEDQEKFSQVKSLDDLRKFTAGSSVDWPSTAILKHNNLPVIAVTNTALLFPMLKMKRFDYMSRNMFEAWAEAEHYEQDGLMIEQSLLLHGGVPLYFFVSKANPKLAERIERGLRIALADGSFEKLFSANENFKRGITEINSSNRKRLELNLNYPTINGESSNSSELPSNH